MNVNMELGEMPSASVRNVQRKPPGWDMLLECATDIIDPQLPYNEQEEAATAVARQTHELSPESFDENRYYGYGLIVCSAMRSLSTPSGRERLVEEAASSLVSRHERFCANEWNEAPDPHRGLYLHELDRRQMVTTGVRDLGKQHLGMAERLTANVLGSTIIEYPENLVTDRERYEILREEPALGRVAANTFAGASLVMRTVLQKLYDRRSGGGEPAASSNKQEPNHLLKDVVNEEELRSLKSEKINKIMASVRLDELALVEHIELDENNQPHIDRSHIPATPGPAASAWTGGLRHEKRLRCPALYVAGAVPLVAQALPEVVIRAQRQLLQNKAA